MRVSVLGLIFFMKLDVMKDTEPTKSVPTVLHAEHQTSVSSFL